MRPRPSPRALRAARSSATSRPCPATRPSNSCRESAARRNRWRAPPSRSPLLSPTATLPLPESHAGALEHVDLVLLHETRDPARERLHDLVAVLSGARMSNSTPFAEIPNSAPSLTSVSTSAARSIAFAGMQASFRQRPAEDLAARRPRSSCRPARHGSRPRNRPGPRADHDHVVAGLPSALSLLTATAAAAGPASGCRASALTRNQNSAPGARDDHHRTSNAPSTFSAADQQERPDDDQDQRSRIWNPSTAQ